MKTKDIKIIKGKLMATRIFSRSYDNKLQVEIGLVNSLSEFISTNDNSFNAHWLQDLICVLNRTRVELNNQDKYNKVISPMLDGGVITEYTLKN